MRLLKAQRGQAMAEMAVVLPILVFLLLGILTTGIAINSKIAVSGAAREAARNYAINQSDSLARDTAETFLRGSVAASGAEFSSHFDKLADVTIGVQGDYVTVQVTYHQPSYVPLLPVFLGGSAWGNTFTLSSSATFKIEQ